MAKHFKLDYIALLQINVGEINVFITDSDGA